MAATIDRPHLRPLHPLHAILLAFVFPLFLGALLSDVAYSSSYHIQWSNFAAWLIFGALLFTGLTLLWASIDCLRHQRDGNRRRLIYPLLLAATFVLGFVNTLIHAKDAYATMPDGLILSLVVTVLALAASWIGYSGFQNGEVK